MPDSTRLRVKDFADSLALAVFDRRLELSGKKVLYYYDADVVLGMVLGFEDEVANRWRGDRENLLRSLLSCHFLGTVFMVGPHLNELHSRIRRQPAYSSLADAAAFKSKARRFLKEHGIEGIMSDLHAVATQAQEEGPASEKLDRFLDILRPNAGRVFSAIEQINGSWSRRLRRFWNEKLISLDRLGPEISELVETQWDIIHTITQILTKNRVRRRTAFSDLQDATALAIIDNMIKEADEGRTDSIVRFYTESAWRGNEDIGRLLSYKRPLADGLATPKGGERAICDSSHLLMRVRFQELRIGQAAFPLDEIEKMLAQLGEVLKLNEQEFESAIKNIKFGDQDLISIIDDLENLRLMDTVLVRDGLPEGLVRNLSELGDWTSVFRFVQGSEASSKIFEQIEDIQGTLESRLSHISSWTRDVDWLLKASRSTRERIKGQLEDPMRDLGLVRWGYSLSQDEQEALVDIVGVLLSDDQADVTTECIQLATRLEKARGDLKQCKIMCAVLWALGRFSEIVTLVEICSTNTGLDLPASLEVIKTAAHFKSRIVADADEKRKIIDDVWALRDSASEDKERSGILLGVGYVVYHAWKQENLGSRIPRKIVTIPPDEVEEWAKKSFKAGEEAASLLPPNELAWAFAVNHCTYVGTVTGVNQERTADYFQELLRLQTFSQIWNYRFDDTMGCHYLAQVEQEWKEAPEERRKDLDLAEKIEQAEKYFERAAQKDFGDIDLDEHVGRLIEIKEKWRKLREL